jgi:RecA-family ATPase
MLGEHLVMSIAAGAKHALGHPINKRTDALIVDFELDEDTKLRRLHDLAAGMGIKELPDGLDYIEAAV